MEELAKRFADLAEKYGPAVADAAKEAARIEAYSTLAASTLLLAVALIFGYGGLRSWRWAGNEDEEIGFGLAALLWLIGGSLFACFIWAWIDPWTWTAINHPELWIAKKAFKL